MKSLSDSDRLIMEKKFTYISSFCHFVFPEQWLEFYWKLLEALWKAAILKLNLEFLRSIFDIREANRYYQYNVRIISLGCKPLEGDER